MTSTIAYKTNTDRLNPQFIGIAQKFNTHKKNRVQVQRQYKTYYSTFHFLQKLNENLDRHLQSKRLSVAKAKSAFERHQNDIARKQEQQRYKKQYVQFLHHRSIQHRKKHSKIMESCLSQMKKEKRSNHKRIKQSQQQIRLSIINTKLQDKVEKQNKCHFIQYEKVNAINKINKFYKNKNSQSVDYYFDMINNQDKKSQRYLNDIHQMKKNMEKFVTKAQKKGKQLEALDDELKKYNTLCFSTSLNKSSNRDLLSQSSRRSNPKYILFKRKEQYEKMHFERPFDEPIQIKSK